MHFVNNKQIFLKKIQIEFLISNIKNEKLASKLSKLLDEKTNCDNNCFTNRYSLIFSINEVEETLDELTFLLTLIGLNQEGEINNQGLFIEELIDLFSRS